LTSWYSSKQETCTASAEAYQNKVNENYPGVIDYVGTVSADGGTCYRRGTVTWPDGSVGGIAPQDVGWFQERSCQYKPEELSCSVGNPTLPALGTKTHTEAIYSGVFAAPLAFELNYRTAYSGRAMLPNGTWLHSFSGRLQIDPLVSDVHAMAGDGSVVRFSPGATADTWTSTESADTLTRVPAATPTAVTWELLRLKSNTRETYDHTGRLLKTTARNGWITALTYNVAGQLQTVSNAFGRQLSFSFDSNGFLATLTAPGGEITRFGHDAQGNLLTITWPDGNIKRYHYEDSRFPRALTGIAMKPANASATTPMTHKAA
jgi:YD repeat-containing protein